MHYTLSLAQLTKADVSLAGGKGANLGEMISAGFPVPAGFLVTTRAYDAFVHAHDLQETIEHGTGAVDAADPPSSVNASEKIRAAFMRCAISDDLASDITQAYEGLTEAQGDAVAVRSSATAEDLPTASFAGQQDTFLNVRGEDALLDAVKACWASLWTARAIAYRMRQRIHTDRLSLAVIVQQLVPARASGVMFTANPINGQRDQIVINANWGIGETVVGGQVMPDNMTVDKSTWNIVGRETGTKTRMTVLADRGTEEHAVPDGQQRQQVLDDEAVVELARCGAQIETHFGVPMDIEWATARGQIAILQARPITSLPEPTPSLRLDPVWEPIARNTIWMRRQIVEHMPEPLSPLFEDLYVRQGLNQSMGKVMQWMREISGVRVAFHDWMPHGFAAAINGYAYTCASFDMSWSNMIPIFRIYSRIFKLFGHERFDFERVVLPQYQALIARWGALDLGQAEDGVLLSGIRELAAADSEYWFGAGAKLALARIMDALFNWLLRSFLIRRALPKPRPVSASFLRGFDSKALDAQADMEAIANLIRESAALRELVVNTPANQLIEALAGHPDAQPITERIGHYLDQYGHQIYNLDFVAPTQSEDPLPMLLSLQALVREVPDQDVRTRQATLAEQRETMVDKTVQSLGFLRRRLFQWVWKWTKHFAPYREKVLFYLGAAWPTLRGFAGELGRRLTVAGMIARPEDIYYLDGGEIGQAIEARAAGRHLPELEQRARERRALRRARMQLTPPDRVPEQASLKVGPIDLSMFDPTPSGAANEGALLRGYAVSTGRVTAPASVIQSTADFDQMKPGTILVCTTTTPAWTPLFSQAAGLVTDIGGALAHGSIVAREYGIPAVMGTGVATERIQSGMMLVVDGDAGTVTMME